MEVMKPLIQLLILISFLACNKLSVEDGASTAEGGSTATQAPTTLANQTPAAPSGVSARPTFRIYGIVSGQAVRLYTTSTCDSPSLVGSGTSTGPFVDIQVEVASSLSDGTYQFYAEADDSECSTASVSYTKHTCPTDYVFVPRNTDLGTGDFCIMKFEAREVAGVATSQSTGLPWVSINDQDAMNECQSLNPVTLTNYDIVSNADWVATAREIENNPINFYAGILYVGHSDADPNSPIGIADPNDSWTETNNNSSIFAQRRTLRLTSGEVIWDFSGNVWEIVDWVAETPNTTITSPNITCNIGWSELSFGIASCPGDFNYLNVGPIDTSLNSSTGAGKMLADPGTTGVMRGGMYNHYGQDYNGMYALHMNRNNNGGGEVGFRCVYRF